MGNPVTDEQAIVTKHCRKCDTTKPISDFHLNRAAKDGHTTYCSACNNAVSRAFHQANKDAENAGNKAWREANREALKAYRETRQEEYRDIWNDNRLRQRFGITLVEYHETLFEQGGGCDICATTEPGGRSGEFFEVDHDHGCCPQKYGICGKCIRGLLCHRCNSYVVPVFEGRRNGSLGDLAEAVAAYMERYKERRGALDEAA